MLVVGASATGVQIAHEIQRSGRAVTMAVGEHVRGPRVYRGRDIHWWMDATGVLDERYDQVDDIVRARRVPSMQLAGSPERATFDLNALTSIGVTLVGRLAGIRDGHAQLSGSLRNKCELADLKLGRLLDTFDEWATANGMDDSVPPPHRFPPTVVSEPPTLDLDLGRGDIRTIIWATGFRPDYSWLDVDVLDAKGMVRHDGGVVDAAWDVPDRGSVPSPAQVQLHRRWGRRRPGPHRRAGGVPGRSSLVGRSRLLRFEDVAVDPVAAV